MDITQLKGVGAVTANNLNRLSVYTVEDLVKLYPRDYDVYEEPVFSLVQLMMIQRLLL